MDIGKSVTLAQVDGWYSPECSVFVKMAFVLMVLLTYSSKQVSFYHSTITIRVSRVTRVRVTIGLVLGLGFSLVFVTRLT